VFFSISNKEKRLSQGEKENRGDKNNNNSSSSNGSGGNESHWRHPKNFGGTDFNNVRSKMKEVKEKQVPVYWQCKFYLTVHRLSRLGGFRL